MGRRGRKKILCVKLLGLGSVVLALPLLKKLKDENYEIHFLTLNGNGEVLRLSGLVDTVWVLPHRSILLLFRRILWMFWKIRSQKFDVLLDLEPTSNLTAIFSYLSGARHRLGFMASKSRRESLYTSLVSYSNERHIAENNLLFLKLLGSRQLEKPKLPEYTEEHPKNLKKYIVVSVNSSDLSWHRQWPDHAWVDFISKMLLAEPEMRIFLPGTKKEWKKVEKIVSTVQSPRVKNIAGMTTLPELMGLLRDSRLVVSVDSGIMHMAAWAGAPVVALFGPETPRMFAPLAEQRKVLWARLPCSPCLSVSSNKVTACRDNQCMKLITPETVLKASQDLLETQIPRKFHAA